jgi:hypothetical protein
MQMGLPSPANGLSAKWAGVGRPRDARYHRIRVGPLVGGWRAFLGREV